MKKLPTNYNIGTWFTCLMVCLWLAPGALAPAQSTGENQTAAADSPTTGAVATTGVIAALLGSVQEIDGSTTPALAARTTGAIAVDSATTPTAVAVAPQDQVAPPYPSTDTVVHAPPAPVFGPAQMAQVMQALDLQSMDPALLSTLEPALLAFEEGDEDTANIRLNFRGASLDSVLDYLSMAAGFIIVRQANVEGRVDAWSHQPLTRAEAVELLSTVLYDKGFAVIQNGRILKIVSRGDAKIDDLDVRVGSDPSTIPRSDRIVHQIIPVRNANAIQLVRNIQELLPDDAEISANESSNAIILTTTLATINRVSRIIQALDTSIAEITETKVFRLMYADANEMARIITSVYQQPATGGGRGGGGNDDRRRQAEAMMRRFGGQGGAPGMDETGVSEARSAAARVAAVADTRSNALIVSVAAEAMPSIEALILEMDQPTQTAVEIEVYPLSYADTTEVANAVNQIFGDGQNTQQAAGGRGGGRNPFDRGGQQNTANQNRTERTMMEGKVSALPDTRTNSVIVLASAALQGEIGAFISRMDVQSDTIGKIEIYALEYADAEEMANAITQVFSSANTGGGAAAARGGRGGVANFRGIMGAATQTSTASRGAAGLVDVTAVPDTRTNSVIVSAAEGMHPQIADLIRSLDTSAMDMAEIRVFVLQHADAEETAALVTSVFQNQQNQGQTARGGRNQRTAGAAAVTAGSWRLAQQQVTATADMRTNSVIVSAAAEMMGQVGDMITQLDEDPARKQRVYVYPVENTNPQELQYILSTMFSGTGTATNRNRTTTTNRTNTGTGRTGAFGQQGGQTANRTATTR